jgi:hypothetical protein
MGSREQHMERGYDSEHFCQLHVHAKLDLPNTERIRVLIQSLATQQSWLRRCLKHHYRSAIFTPRQNRPCHYLDLPYMPFRQNILGSPKSQWRSYIELFDHGIVTERHLR